MIPSERKQTHVMYGCITGLVTIVFYLVLYVTKLSFKDGMQYVPYIPFLGGIILNGINFSKANGGAVTFGNVFGSCFKASIIVTLFAVAWMILSMYIFPEMKTQMLEVMREKMAKNPQMTDEMLDKSMGWMQKNFTTIMVSGALFGELIGGALFSLVGAAVAKKNALPVSGDNF